MSLEIDSELPKCTPFSATKKKKNLSNTYLSYGRARASLDVTLAPSLVLWSSPWILEQKQVMRL